MKLLSKSLVVIFGLAWGVLFTIPIVSFAQDYFQASGIPVHEIDTTDLKAAGERFVELVNTKAGQRAA